MSKITLKFLENLNACEEGIDWWNANELASINHKELIGKLMGDNRFSYANWLVVRLCTRYNKLRYVIFAAELVLHIVEEKYPDDKRPRKVIEAAKDYLENPCEETANAAVNAAAAAVNADAADAADAVADADAYADAYVAYAGCYADYAVRKKIIKYGLKLIEEQCDE